MTKQEVYNVGTVNPEPMNPLKKMKLLISILAILFLFIATCECSPIDQDKDVLFQTSTINALLEGVFEGELTFEELKEHGDFGLGTFNNLDGEMICLDSTFYQIRADGKVYPVDGTQMTPFAVMTFFEPDATVSLKKPLDYNQLKQYIDELLPTRNIFYAIKIEGLFKYIKARSVPRQKKPFPNVMDIIKRQPIFEFDNIRGTIVGFRLPKYMNGINVPGYHCHFITADKKAGGHVLECLLQDVKIEIDYTARSYITLPELADFYSADLAKENKIDINKVEK
ncbi:MAG: acetolactate decarboxylase [Candidatus Anammoxibacter sp.]